MPTSTTNFSFNKPLVNDPVDEDIWGGQLNTNWDSIDTILDALTPIGSRMGFTGTTAPNSRWLLAFGQAVSRTTYAVYFTLVGTNYGVGDGATTFNMPDYRGRAAVGLDNLGGTPANRITDANADSLNNTGMGSETDAGTNDVTGGHPLTADENGPHTHGQTQNTTGVGSNYNLGAANDDATPVASTNETLSSGSGTPHAHPGSTWTGTTGSNVQASIAEAIIIRVL